MTCGKAAIIYTTLPDMEQARKLGEALVREHLAACVNMLPAMQSIYEWKGDMQHDEEVVLLAKTTRERAKALKERIAALHPYETPAILHLPVMDVNASYFTWLSQQTTLPEAVAEEE